MKLSGTHKFAATSAKVFDAILNPEVLKSSITGCSAASYLDANHIALEISTSLPGLKGPYGITIGVENRQAPHHVDLHVVRQGKGGSVNAQAHINLTDEADGTLLSYDANAELDGAIAIANNPIGQGIVKNALSSFFKNLEKSL